MNLKKTLASLAGSLAVSAQRAGRLTASAPSAVPGALIYAPAQHGSFGDEALVLGSQTALQAAGVTTSALVPGPSAPWADIGVASPVSEDPLLRGGGLLWRAPLDARVAQPASAFVIGADAIDGAYGIREIGRRVSYLNAMASTGRRAALVNFSFREAQDPNALRLLRKLRPDVGVFARDIHSQRRASAALSREVGISPDVGLYMPAAAPGPETATPEIEEFFARPRVKAALVVNGHLGGFGLGSEDNISSYFASIARLLREQDVEVAIVAHDLRADPGDPELAREVARLVPGTVAMVPTTAQRAKALLSRADLCVTARMHGGVAAMSSGVPTIGLDYVDKFIGQFDWYGQSERVIPWGEALQGDRVAHLIESTLRDLDAVTHELRSVTGRLALSSPSWL